MSTISPIATRRFAQQLSDAGPSLLDAPVSGGEKGAIDGTLSIMVGGTQSDFDRAKPLFDVMGGNIVRVGDSGAGQIAKACNQLVVAGTIEAVAEALTLASAAGVDAGRVRDALLGGFAGSKILEVHGQRMLDEAFTPGFRARLHLKDAHIVSDTARELGVPTPGFAPVEEELQRLVDEGKGDLDHSALITLLQEDSAKE
jgi:3-hydroxyisobutyrate dehydrogenase-like beta-hydroxyacid dehydrogenase